MRRDLLLMGKNIQELILSESVEEVYGNTISLMEKIQSLEKCAIYIRNTDVASKKGIFIIDENSPETVLKAAETGREIRDGNEIAIPVIVDEVVAGVLYASQKEDQKHDGILGVIAGLVSTSIKNVMMKRKAIQSEKLYRGIIENAVEGIYASTLDGQIIEVNQSLVNFFGYESKEELKNVGIQKTYVNPGRREDFIKTLMEEKKVRNYEIEYRKKDGEIVIGNEFATLAENGEKVIQGIIHDVTELKKMQREVEFYNALLRHDMWNKNQVILGYLELLLDTGLSEEQSKFVESAKLAVRNNMGLIDDVRKLFTARKQQEAEQMDIDEAIEDIINQLLHEADKRGISIYYAPSGIKVGGIPLLKEVFYNILLDAIFHSQCRNIRIDVRYDKNFCKITIEDDGTGIAPEIKKDIFRRKVEKGKRNGLGLYLSGRIVEMGGGSIEVKNRVEKGIIRGTIFEISVPMQNDFKR